MKKNWIIGCVILIITSSLTIGVLILLNRPATTPDTTREQTPATSQEPEARKRQADVLIAENKIPEAVSKLKEARALYKQQGNQTMVDQLTQDIDNLESFQLDTPAPQDAEPTVLPTQ